MKQLALIGKVNKKLTEDQCPRELVPGEKYKVELDVNEDNSTYAIAYFFDLIHDCVVTNIVFYSPYEFANFFTNLKHM